MKRKLKALSLVLLLLGASCILPGNIPPSVKIGLIAPFEGLYRTEGYDALYAVKMAVREANASQSAKRYRLEIVALDDKNRPAEARVAAGKISLDPEIVGVIGHLSEDATLAALPIYSSHNLPLLVPIPLLEDSEALAGTAFLTPLYSSLWTENLCSKGKALVFSCPGSAIQRKISAHCPAEKVDFYCYPEFPPQPQEYKVTFWPGDEVKGAEVLLKLREKGFKGEFWGRPGVCSSLFEAFAGERGSWCLGFEEEPDAAFVDEYRKISGAEPGPFAYPAYVAAKTLIKAIAEASAEGEVTRKGVRLHLSRNIGKP